MENLAEQFIEYNASENKIQKYLGTDALLTLSVTSLAEFCVLGQNFKALFSFWHNFETTLTIF